MLGGTAFHGTFMIREQRGHVGYRCGTFLTVIYQQLILIVNRPFLSLKPTTPEFQSGLQTCIGAGRSIISTLREQSSRRQCLAAPGMLSSIWMSGLVISFACELNIYPLTKAILLVHSTCLYSCPFNCFYAVVHSATKFKGSLERC